MGRAYYECPESLWREWWKPLELAAYSVEPLPSGHLPASAEQDELDSGYGGWVRHGQPQVLVSSAILPFDDRPEYALSLLTGPHRRAMHEDLAASIERILLASGARLVLGKPRRCQALYRCPPGLVQSWWEHLGTEGIDVELPGQRATEEGGAAADEHVDADGVARKSGTVTVFTGPAVNPNTGEYFYYLALDFECTGGTTVIHRNRKLAVDVDGILTNRGAERIPIWTWRARPRGYWVRWDGG